MKKLFFIALFAFSFWANAQLYTNYKPLFIYNFSNYDLEIQLTTCQYTSVFNGNINGIAYPVFSTPAPFIVPVDEPIFKFEHPTPYNQSLHSGYGLSFNNYDFNGMQNTLQWRRKPTSTSSYFNISTLAAQATYGYASQPNRQKWWYAKLGIFASNGDYVTGNLGNWDNVVVDGYSVQYGNNLIAEWIEDTPDPNFPEYVVTYIIIS